jgi:hypothetical protein
MDTEQSNWRGWTAFTCLVIAGTGLAIAMPSSASSEAMNMARSQRELDAQHEAERRHQAEINQTWDGLVSSVKGATASVLDAPSSLWQWAHSESPVYYQSGVPGSYAKALRWRQANCVGSDGKPRDTAECKRVEDAFH